jgi:hypothetical protein
MEDHHGRSAFRVLSSVDLLKFWSMLTYTTETASQGGGPDCLTLLAHRERISFTHLGHPFFYGLLSYLLSLFHGHAPHVIQRSISPSGRYDIRLELYVVGSGECDILVCQPDERGLGHL